MKYIVIILLVLLGVYLYRRTQKVAQNELDEKTSAQQEKPQETTVSEDVIDVEAEVVEETTEKAVDEVVVGANTVVPEPEPE
ncbi:hypothetical protein AB4128_09540, partial [Shewanella sp. 10N.286.52.A9]